MLTIFLYRGLKRVFSNYSNCDKETDYKSISIIAAAKNEEENLDRFFDSLKSQNYPHADFEVILVDDNSSDKTFIKAEEFSKNILNKKIIRAGKKIFPGKKGALKIGIDAASFQYILITDADCFPGNNWIKKCSEKFSAGDDLLFGIAPLTAQNNFNIPLFENLRTSILTFAAAGLNLPYSAASRSFGFSLKAFNKINGYKNIQETLSGDDDLFIREAVKNNLKIGIVTERDAFVYSTAKGNLKDYLQQKSRHVKTSLHYLPRHKLLLTVWHSLNIIFILSPIFAFVSLKFFLLFLIKILADLIIIKKYQHNFGYKFSIAEIIAHQFLYEIFLVINFINALFKKDKWK